MLGYTARNLPLITPEVSAIYTRHDRNAVGWSDGDEANVFEYLDFDNPNLKHLLFDYNGLLASAAASPPAATLRPSLRLYSALCTTAERSPLQPGARGLAQSGLPYVGHRLSRDLRKAFSNTSRLVQCCAEGLDSLLRTDMALAQLVENRVPKEHYGQSMQVAGLLYGLLETAGKEVEGSPVLRVDRFGGAEQFPRQNGQF